MRAPPVISMGGIEHKKWIKPAGDRAGESACLFPAQEVAHFPQYSCKETCQGSI